LGPEYDYEYEYEHQTKRNCAGVLALLLVLGAAGVARAQDEGAVVRVIAEEAEVRTGPGFAYRAVYTATRGETLKADSRASRDYWFHVVLPDGTYGWIIGDQVLPLDVDPTAPQPPTWGDRFAAAVFSPPPLVASDVSLSFSAGLLGGEGMLLFRPAILVAPHLGVEGFIGETVGEQTDVIYYGGGANLYLWPSWPVTMFVAVGGGGAKGRKKADLYTVNPGHYAMANAGGGLLIALKKRITLRFDFRDYVVFGANYTQELKEFSGGLAVLF
jgi:hypothetical protein